MGTKFNKCPNCGHTPQGIFGFAKGYFTIYECKDCGTCYCFNCGDRCPDCASKNRREAGEVY